MVSKDLSALAVLLLLVPGAARDTEFSAVLHLKEDGQEAALEFLVKGDVYYVKGEVEGRDLVFFTDKAAGKTTVLEPEAKTWQVIEGHGAARFDPFLGFAMWKESFQKAELGTETIDGRSVVHSRYTHPEQEGVALDVWHSDELEQDVRQVLERLGKKREILLTDIEVGPVDPSRMEIPEGYTRKLTNDEIEAALPCLSGLEETTAPVGRRLMANGELRVKLDKERRANVRAESRGEGEAAVTVTAYADGRPKQSIGVSDWKFQYKGQSRNYDYNNSGKPFQTDEVRIKVSSGVVRVTVVQKGEDGEDTYMRGGSGLWGDVDPETGLTLTMTGDNQAGQVSVGTIDTWTADDVKKTEEFSIRNGESRTWTFAPDSGVVRYGVTMDLGQGGLRIRTR